MDGEKLRGELSALIGEFAEVRDQMEGDFIPRGSDQCLAAGADTGRIEPHTQTDVRAGVYDREAEVMRSNKLLEQIGGVVAQAVLSVEDKVDVENVLGVLHECIVDMMEDMDKFGGVDAAYRMFLEQVVAGLAKAARGQGKGAGVEGEDGASGDEAVSGVGNVRRAARDILMEED